PFNYRGDYVIDTKGRIWMGEIGSANGRNFVQTGLDGSVIQSIKVPNDFVAINSYGPYSFPDPANFIKLDPVTNSMNFLHRDPTEALSVFQFSSDY
ncbi:MAG: hypothetical protein ACOYXC_15905, partial [Candidatus Rifleibacteriota bacterium]